MLRLRNDALTIRHTVAGSRRRDEVEEFIRATFKSRFGAEVTSFAPNLMALELDDRVVAAAGWRCAADEPLFLETYLDVPVEAALAKLAGHPVERARIVEVGNLAAARAGGSIDVILALSRHLDRLGYEWVAFTATRELIGIFRKLGSGRRWRWPPPTPSAWASRPALGHYYDSALVVVAGHPSGTGEIGAPP
jgi:hypothetical protein